MVSSRQQQEYRDTIDLILKRRSACKHSQCFGFSKKEARCQLCLNQARAASSRQPRCWRHENHASDRLNRFSRRGELVYGFDPLLMTESDRKFADDAIETALKIFLGKANARRIQIGWLSQVTSHMLEYTHAAPPLWKVFICNLDDHWFMLAQGRSAADKLFVFNSLRSFQVSERRIRRLRGMAHSEDLSLVLIDDLPQQSNLHDCGAFAILFAYCLIYNKDIPDEIEAPDEESASSAVRHQVVLMLLTKVAETLNALLH